MMKPNNRTTTTTTTTKTTTTKQNDDDTDDRYETITDTNVFLERQEQQQQQQRDDDDDDDDIRQQLVNNHHYTLLICLFVIITAMKILLFPSYKSTDFDVHNHWKSLTRTFYNDPKEWYFDNDHIVTTHTVDYPPSFVYFEYFWSNNYITSYLLTNSLLDENCLILKESATTTTTTSSMKHSVACVAYMRTTVLLSELVYWIACYIWASLIGTYNNNTNNSNGKKKKKKKNISRNFSWNTYLLLTLNPSILWLDHVHFQYNGFLLGILLLSIACLWQGLSFINNNITSNSSTSTTTTTSSSSITTTTNKNNNNDNGTQQQQQQDQQSNLYDSSYYYYYFHLYHLLGAILYSLLLTFKHLYMTLGLWYFFYLLRKYCFVLHFTTTNTATTNNQNNNNSIIDIQTITFSMKRLLVLGFVTLLTLIVPFIPFLLVQPDDDVNNNNNNEHHHDQNTKPQQQIQRIVQRLFPFGRGLVHDYWAGNIWALYMAIHKISGIVIASKTTTNNNIIPNELSPFFVAIVLFISLLPGCYCAWQAAATTTTGTATTTTTNTTNKTKSNSLTQHNTSSSSQSLLLLGLTYTALASFMTAYHVHEKAIVTTLLPLIVWTMMKQPLSSSTTAAPKTFHSCNKKVLLFRTHAFALTGLLPLLFPSTELAMKLVTGAAYLFYLYWVLFQQDQQQDQQRRNTTTINTTTNQTIHSSFHWKRGNFIRLLFSESQEIKLIILLIVVVIIVVEVIPISYFGKYEFIPLAFTSVIVACGLSLSFVELLFMILFFVRVGH